MHKEKNILWDRDISQYSVIELNTKIILISCLSKDSEEVEQGILYFLNQSWKTWEEKKWSLYLGFQNISVKHVIEWTHLFTMHSFGILPMIYF